MLAVVLLIACGLITSRGSGGVFCQPGFNGFASSRKLELLDIPVLAIFVFIADYRTIALGKCGSNAMGFGAPSHSVGW